MDVVRHMINVGGVGGNANRGKENGDKAPSDRGSGSSSSGLEDEFRRRLRGTLLDIDDADDAHGDDDGGEGKPPAVSSSSSSSSESAADAAAASSESNNSNANKDGGNSDNRAPNSSGMRMRKF